MPAHQGLQLLRVVHIGLHHRHARQHLDVTRWQATGGHGDLVQLHAQASAHMAANKAAATEHQYFLWNVFALHG